MFVRKIRPVQSQYIPFPSPSRPRPHPPIPRPPIPPPNCLFNECKCPFICEKLGVCFGHFETPKNKL